MPNQPSLPFPIAEYLKLNIAHKTVTLHQYDDHRKYKFENYEVVPIPENVYCLRKYVGPREFLTLVVSSLPC